MRKFVLEFFSDLFRKEESLTAWCEDTPGNIFNIDFLIKLFPNAKFIHVMRNPVGVAYSMHRMVWGPKNLVQTCDLLEELYRRLIDIHKRYSSHSQYCFIRLEDLVEEGNKIKLYKFLDLNPEGFSGKISIQTEKMNYYQKEMSSDEFNYVFGRLKFATDFFEY